MPKYDVKCQVCAQEWEISKGMNQDLPPCPTCGGPVDQLPPKATNFILKGRGWAKDGYAG